MRASQGLGKAGPMLGVAELRQGRSMRQRRVWGMKGLVGETEGVDGRVMATAVARRGLSIIRGAMLEALRRRQGVGGQLHMMPIGAASYAWTTA
jgi:hypothetical protein